MQMRALEKAIGLDFGTTNSALAIAEPDQTVQLAEFQGSATFRSIIYFEEVDGALIGKLRVVAGPDAIQSYLNAKTPGRLISVDEVLSRQPAIHSNTDPRRDLRPHRSDRYFTPSSPEIR